MVMENSRKVRIYMSRKRLKRMAAMMLAVVLTVCAAAPAGSFVFASGADTQSKAAEEAVTEESREPEPGEAEVPDLAEGEMPELTTVLPNQ